MKEVSKQCSDWLWVTCFLRGKMLIGQEMVIHCALHVPTCWTGAQLGLNECAPWLNHRTQHVNPKSISCDPTCYCRTFNHMEAGKQLQMS